MAPLLQVENLSAGYGGVKIVRDVVFNLHENEVLGIVGESGCGKSTMVKAIARLKGMNTEILSGNIRFKGQDLSTLSKEKRRKIMGEDMAIIFQNPEASLNPSRKIGHQFLETMQNHRGAVRWSEMRDNAAEIFNKIGLDEVDRILDAYPFQLSGGMAQRVAVALAMLLKPKLILADEPTSALDTTVQKQVVEEMLALKKSLNTAMIVISHNMGVVGKMADTIAVMYGGRIVEIGCKEQILNAPAHPYTKALLSAVPKLGAGLPVGLKGRPPHFSCIKEGCGFYDRCIYCTEKCASYNNVACEIRKDHWVLCGRKEIYA
ncbi:MAG: ABC transporter ATP-binding protein [Eubacteriaceae bacterium]|jgi:oligopeptide/dipeptide ABC transporter ATP-binding protein|nr:ABC transporter ATP-binding protein [Eubacteriaceae bacterium]